MENPFSVSVVINAGNYAAIERYTGYLGMTATEAVNHIIREYCAARDIDTSPPQSDASLLEAILRELQGIRREQK